MTQLYTEILETETLTNSRALILNNDKTIMSCSSGTAFPTANLQVGMLCLRTDQNKLYQLKDATPTWTLIGDLLMDYNTVVQAKGNISTTTGDWNTYVTAGVYQVGGANWTGSTNGPNTAKSTLYSYGQLVVTVYGSVVMQMYIAHSATQTGGIYFRMKYNATDWTPWSIQWNSTNDGAGSGLDADLLDGENLVDNAATANTVVGRDANGDIFVVTLRGANINITGSAVLGDAVTDTHTINGSPTVTGDVFMQNNKKVRWDGNTDFAEIMYVSLSDNDTRLRIGVGDNGNEQIEIGQYNGATFNTRLRMNPDGSIQALSNFSANAIFTGNLNSATISQGGKLSYDSEQSAASGMNTLSAATFMAGKPLYSDPCFRTSLNSISVYDNNASGQTTHALVAAATDCPTDSPYELQVTHAGSGQTPGYGGFFFATDTSNKQNHTLALVFKAKLPVGYNFQWASNEAGNNNANWWATDRNGTGRYEDYVYVLKVGVGGLLSSTHFIYVENAGGATPTAGAPLVWRLAFANVFDVDSLQNLTEDFVMAEARAPYRFDFPDNVNHNGAHNAGIFMREDGVAFTGGWNQHNMNGYGRIETDTSPGSFHRVGFRYHDAGLVLARSARTLSLQHYSGILADTYNRIWTWGYGGANNLGTGNANNQIIPVLTKTETSPIYRAMISAISYSSYHTAGYVTDDGRLYGTGQNSHGQLAQNTSGNSYPSWTLLPQQASQPWKDFYMDGLSTFAWTSDATGNKLYACGHNARGNLGVGDAAQKNVFTPCVINGTTTQLTGVKKVQSTMQHDTYTQTTIALLTNGNLYGCGINNYGTLGQNNTSQHNGFVLIATGVVDFAVGGGGDASLIYYKTDSSVWGVGYNAAGTLGMNDSVNRYVPTRIYSGGYTGGTTAGGGTPQGSPHTAKFVAAADLFETTAFVDTFGRAWAAGTNEYGHIGATGTDASHTTYVQALINEPVVKVAMPHGHDGSTAFRHTYWLTETGQVYGCGYNSHGEVPSGRQGWIMTPQRLHFQPT